MEALKITLRSPKNAELGPLCKRGHNFNETGQSLRSNGPRKDCLFCRAENAKRRYADPDRRAKLLEARRRYTSETPGYRERNVEYQREYRRGRREEISKNKVAAVVDATRVDDSRERHLKALRDKIVSDGVSLPNTRASYGASLGPLCKNGHDHDSTGKSMRLNVKPWRCVLCLKISSRIAHTDASRKAKAEAAHQRRLRDPEAREKVLHTQREYRKLPAIRLRGALRGRMRTAFQQFSETGKVTTAKEYGVDFGAVIEGLGPCPGDRKDFHVDHIIPLSMFDFDDPEHVRLAFAPENHRWLPRSENFRKHNSLPKACPQGLERQYEVALQECRRRGKHPKFV